MRKCDETTHLHFWDIITPLFKAPPVPRTPPAQPDPDRIEAAPGHFPDSQFSSLFNWRQFPADLLGGPDNRRLLPDSPNGVHIIDGPTHRYYVGIVDILDTDSPRRQLQGWLRSLLSCSENNLGATADKYAIRFHDFMLDYL